MFKLFLNYTLSERTINVKIDADVKESAVSLLSRMGIDQTTAIDMFYRKIIAARTLPFQPEPLPTNGEQLLAAIKKNIPNITLPVNENGYTFIDKVKHPLLISNRFNPKRVLSYTTESLRKIECKLKAQGVNVSYKTIGHQKQNSYT